MTEAFQLSPDGWYQIAAVGEFPHPATGLTQIVDDDACRKILADFDEKRKTPEFAGVLLDFDHFSLDKDKPSEAAGWITELQHRPGAGLFARIRFSDTGAESVAGGRYRYVSPVWMRDACEDCGPGRVRPLRLTNCALTNAPNIKGMMPLTNRVTTPPPPAPVPVPRETIRLAFRAAMLNRGAYVTPDFEGIIFINRSMMTDEQRKAMFARMGGGGGGGARPAPQPEAAAAPGAAPAPVAPAAEAPAINHAPDLPTEVAAAQAAGSDGRDVIGINDTTRESAARVAALQKQIDDLQAGRQPPPEPIKRDLINTRTLRTQLMKQGKTPTEIIAAIDGAERANAEIRQGQKELRGQARKYAPGDPEKQRKYLARLLAQQEAQFKKDLGAWKRQDDTAKRAIGRLQVDIAEEEIRGREELNRAAVRDMRDTIAQQAREQTAQARAERAAKEEAERVAKTQAATTAKAERERLAAQKKAASDAKAAEKTTAAQRKEVAAKYWDYLASGDKSAARTLAPDADVDTDAADVLSLIEQAKSINRTEASAARKELAALRTKQPLKKQATA